MKHAIAIIFLLLGQALVTVNASAAEAIGYLSRTFGQVRVDDQAARTGDSFARGNTVSTGPKSLALLKFTDDGIVYLRADSAYRVDRYFYEKGQPKRGEYGATLLRGAMRSVTGLIGKDNAPGVRYQTRVGSIGVRGTGFLAALISGRLFIEVLSGCLDLQPRKAKRLDVCKGERIIVDRDGSIFAQGIRARRMIETQRPFQGLRGARVERFGSVRSWGPWASAGPGKARDITAAPLPLAEPQSVLSAATLLEPVSDVTTLSPVDLDMEAIPSGFEDVGASGLIRGQVSWTTSADIDLIMLFPYGESSVSYVTPATPGGTWAYGNGIVVTEHSGDNLGDVINVPPDTRVENRTLSVVSGTPPNNTISFFARLKGGFGSDTTVRITVSGDGGATSLPGTELLFVQPAQSDSNRYSEYYNVTIDGSSVTYSISPNVTNPY